eukprot:TRINITY_DN4217_c0_g1_i1.p1 TRINITY_DN4217_c0_g1~~TRINITY_DN4217_c0_g1_i1.p1  ORF type:complete len:194 (-),score=44.76 TRINITY_DN4217_c0_g1_i1:390-971(-)
MGQIFNKQRHDSFGVDAVRFQKFVILLAVIAVVSGMFKMPNGMLTMSYNFLVLSFAFLGSYHRSPAYLLAFIVGQSAFVGFALVSTALAVFAAFRDIDVDKVLLSQGGANRLPVTAAIAEALGTLLAAFIAILYMLLVSYTVFLGARLRKQLLSGADLNFDIEDPDSISDIELEDIEAHMMGEEMEDMNEITL